MAYKFLWPQTETGTTGHAETVLLTFNPEKLSYRQLLDILFAKFDMTTKDRQGVDKGPQYRSVIFFATDDQRREAERKIQEFNANLRAAQRWPWETAKTAAVELVPFREFYTAEVVHQRYYSNGVHEEALDADFDHFLWATDIDRLDV